MNEHQRRECEKLRAFSSEEAATYLIAGYGADPGTFDKAFFLMRHRSWRRRDQVRLARHFLQKTPFRPHGQAYPALASFMSLRLLIRLLRAVKPTENIDLFMFRSDVERVLWQRAKSPGELAAVEQFLAELPYSSGSRVGARQCGASDAENPRT